MTTQTTQTQIRQTFARDHSLLANPEKDAWLIQGDFDRFKMTNDLYGYLITDYILDCSIRAIEATLSTFERRLGIGPILWSVTGDDVTIYIPPSTLPEIAVARLLHSICTAVRERFCQRYAISALPFSPKLFATTPPEALEELKNGLKVYDTVIDFAPRRQGYLMLFPADFGGSRERSAQEMTSIIRQRLGKHVSRTAPQWAWLYNPGERACYTVNDGFIYPPSISFGACSARRIMSAESGEAVGGLCFERLAFASETVLKICKQRRCGVLLNHAVLSKTDIAEMHPMEDAWRASLKLDLISERRLREILYFKALDHAMLLQINPVYSFASGAHRECFRLERYRGDAHGVGLKGINELCGHSTANEVIRRLGRGFAESIASTIKSKSMDAAQLLTALFVDRFTVACEQLTFSPVEISELGQNLLSKFNQASEEIKISHLRISIAESCQPITGYALLHNLALAQLSSSALAVVYANLQMEVRQFCQAAASEGRMVLERNAFRGGYQFARNF